MLSVFNPPTIALLLVAGEYYSEVTQRLLRGYSEDSFDTFSPELIGISIEEIVTHPSVFVPLAFA